MCFCNIKLFLHIFFQFALISYKLNYDCNKKFINATLTTYNDGVHDTLLCSKFEFYTSVHNIFTDFQWRIPESPGDMNYRNVFFRTKANVKKIMQGVRGNFLITIFADMLMKSLDFELKFPMKKVRKKCKRIQIITIIYVQKLLISGNLSNNKHHRPNNIIISVQISKKFGSS